MVSIARMIIILVYLASFPSQANCYVVGEFVGYSSRAGDDFEITTDAITDQQFTVEFDGDDGKVVPSNLSCKPKGSNTLLCVSISEGGASVIETWSLYLDSKKVTFSKSSSGYGIFDGGTLMTGSILGKCKS
ncbi:hypothetical protein J6I90_09350 [Pseudidiomarina sp. 1APP75-32.1]|uniref:Uncharacterized protein n=1 Tax=Pseudidiomarina terrestris TaxID=2820060 RepID=A0AAW7QZ98_9GAMM|nr:hypothetical protein [Pseudidiomarina sp. 1APP75-32.1]MDN7125084.1 hypothetical protein [Pseudidiomarina sp. 1APP75-32.1]